MKLLLLITTIIFSIYISSCESRGNTSITTSDTSTHNRYSWLNSYETKNILVNRISLPGGFQRIPVAKHSFADWLRHLPLKPGYPEVKLYDGTSKFNQSAQYAVVNIDVGKEDLQQCADAVMRLKAEFHFSKKEFQQIHFKFTSGDNAEFIKWSEGYRPIVKGNKVSWTKSANPDTSYKNFKAYLRQVFMYAGSSSLSKELQTISPAQLQAGDVFIKGGFPGHAVIVLDIAENPATGKKIFILAQSYMPAQDIHVLKNPIFQNHPWFTLESDGTLQTPEWTFQFSDLKRFNKD